MSTFSTEKNYQLSSKVVEPFAFLPTMTLTIFICIFVIYLPSFGLFILSLLSFTSSGCFLDTSPLPRMSFAKIF